MYTHVITNTCEKIQLLFSIVIQDHVMFVFCLFLFLLDRPKSLQVGDFLQTNYIVYGWLHTKFPNP